MTKSPDNVAVVHCLAGRFARPPSERSFLQFLIIFRRSRTGCVIAGYLMYASYKGTSPSPPLLKTAREAIEYFNFARSEEGLNIVLPSQIRWVHQLEQLLKNNDLDRISNPPTYILKSVRLDPPPLVEGEKRKAALTPITCVKYLPAPTPLRSSSTSFSYYLLICLSLGIYR